MSIHDEHTPPLDWLLEPDPANPGVRQPSSLRARRAGR